MAKKQVGALWWVHYYEIDDPANDKNVHCWKDGNPWKFGLFVAVR